MSEERKDAICQDPSAWLGGVLIAGLRRLQELPGERRQAMEHFACEGLPAPTDQEIDTLIDALQEQLDVRYDAEQNCLFTKFSSKIHMFEPPVMRLSIAVAYAPRSFNETATRAMLLRNAQGAIDRGLLTEGSGLAVDTYGVEVTRDEE